MQSKKSNRPTEQEMLDEYMKAVNLLTINEENRLKLKVELLESEKNEITRMRNELDAMKAMMNGLSKMKRERMNPETIQ